MDQIITAQNMNSEIIFCHAMLRRSGSMSPLQNHAYLSHICEIEPGRTRNLGNKPLPLDGLGNKESSERHVDWNGYDYAYKVNSVSELRPVGAGGFEAAIWVENVASGLGLRYRGDDDGCCAEGLNQSSPKKIEPNNDTRIPI
jgi:hypothetical protein